MNKENWSYFKSTILSDKKLIIGSLLITVMAYGFAITNFSLGVDDPASVHYVHSNGWGSMVQQGRLVHIALDWLTGLVEFIPFINDFIGTALFWASSLAFCFLFQYITNKRFSTWACLAFSGIYLSYSIINEKFIYNLDVIVFMLSYLCIALSVFEAYQAIFEQKKRQAIWSILLCIVGISSYESFIFLYVCAVLSIFVIKAATDREYHLKWKTVICKGLMFAAVLVAACAIYYLMVFIVQMATGQTGFVREGPWTKGWGIKETARLIFLNFKTYALNFQYFPMIVFWGSAILGTVITAWIAVRRKSLLLLLCFLGMFVSNFFVHFIAGDFMYRAAQTCCFFVAVVGLLAVTLIERYGGIKRIFYILVCLLVLLQVRDLNKWFYNDYIRYQKEAFAVHAIATSLKSSYDMEKPVVFTNRPGASYYLTTHTHEGQVNGASMLRWGVGTFGEKESLNMIEIFRLHGYDFLVTPTKEQAEEAWRIGKTMPAWPEKDSIKEMDSYIIVNFDKVQEG